MLFFTDMPFGQAPPVLSNPTKVASLPYGGDNHRTSSPSYNPHNDRMQFGLCRIPYLEEVTCG